MLGVEMLGNLTDRGRAPPIEHVQDLVIVGAKDLLVGGQDCNGRILRPGALVLPGMTILTECGQIRLLMEPTELGVSGEVMDLKGRLARSGPVGTKREGVEDELADVLFFLLRFADLHDIDLEEALANKIEKNRERYPTDEYKGSNRRHTE